jgi:opacity protein-like surface antigen
MKRTIFTRTALISATLFAPLAFAVPAAAQTYVGVSGGISLKNDSENKGVFTGTVPATTVAPIYGPIPTDTTVGWNTEFDKGLNINALVGHRFEGGLRVEAQLSYTKNGVKRHSDLAVGGAVVDAVDASVLTRGATVGATVGTVLDSGIGKTKSLGLYANGYYDFNAGGSFQPYVGAGVGLSRNKVDFRPSNVDVGQGSQTKFSYQLMAGATAKVSDNFEIFGQYTYRDAGKTKFALDLLPADLSVSGKQSIVSLGVRIPFGGAGN